MLESAFPHLIQIRKYQKKKISLQLFFILNSSPQVEFNSISLSSTFRTILLVKTAKHCPESSSNIYWKRKIDAFFFKPKKKN